jgi:hypothetical protein
MGMKKQRIIALTSLFFLGLFATFRGCFSAANQPQLTQKKKGHPTANNRFGSSAVLAVQGNVYPLGYGFFL